MSLSFSLSQNQEHSHMSNPTSSYGIVTVVFMLKVKWGCAFWFHLLLDFSEKQ